jgi:prepilin-type N-terminal cleavage/methylation domain-containing protein
MMNNRFLKRTHGFTLIEALMAMVVMVVIMGSVSTIYLTSTRVWKRCSSQAQADPPAHMTIARISKELRNAYKIDEMGNTSIKFSLPRRDGNGINVVPLQAAEQISYYLSDETGASGATGNILWRRRIDIASGANATQRIAGNVVQLGFSYDATATRVLKIYAISITVVGREGRQEYRSAFGSHIAFRNG